MPSWRELWHIEFLGNDLGAWTLAIVTFLVTFTVLPIVKGYISTRRSRWAGHEPQQVHLAIDLTALLVERTSRVFLWGVALYLGSLHLSLPPRIEHALTVAGVMVFWMQAGLWAVAAVRHALDLRRKRSAGLDALLTSSIDVITFATALVIWAMALLLALDNLGVQIKPLLAGLGISGIAVALAVRICSPRCPLRSTSRSASGTSSPSETTRAPSSTSA